jgi:hypothetical protein
MTSGRAHRDALWMINFLAKPWRLAANPTQGYSLGLHTTQNTSQNTTQKKRASFFGWPVGLKMFGAAGRIRTHDPLVRSQVLYPTELQPHSTALKATDHFFCFACSFLCWWCGWQDSNPRPLGS